MEIRIQRSKRKTLILSVMESNTLTIKAPLYLSQKDIEKVIFQKQKWIENRLKEIDEQSKMPNKNIIKDGGQINYLGQALRIKSTADTNKIIEMDLLSKTIFVNEKYLGSLKSKLEKWLKRRALEYFITRINYFSDNYSFKTKKIKLSSATTRWGSCSHDNNINLNWKLIMADSSISDYVILHELVHTKIKNHSKKFWEELECFLPDYKARKKLLEKSKHMFTF